MERCFGFVSSVMMIMMMMGHDENDNIYRYLPYMICMYVHVQEKRNELEYKVHHRINMKVKIPVFKRHRTFLYPYLHVYNSLNFCQPKK